MKAKEKGFQDAMDGLPHKPQRAYETDKANNAYYEGYAEGLRQKYPEHMIVRCTRHFLIFAAIPSDTISCPGCGRGYLREGKSNIWVSDRELKVIFTPRNQVCSYCGAMTTSGHCFHCDRPI